jgi:hypothetical protein
METRYDCLFQPNVDEVYSHRNRSWAENIVDFSMVDLGNNLYLT